MNQAKNNCCPFCGADEDKYMSGKCCKEAAEELEYIYETS